MKGASLDKDRLVAALGRLGIRPRCEVMAHASLSALGLVEGGAGTVVAALREATGGEGAVIMPSFRGAIRSESYALRECRSVCPQDLCPSREPGTTGIIGETLRAEAAALRSCNPTHSWVGVGAAARFLLEGHRHSLTPCGTDSPFFRLMERDGAILMLGLGVRWLTNIHAAEDAFNLPYLSAFDPERRHATYTTSGRRLQYVYPDLLQEIFTAAGLLRSASIGAGRSHALSARELGSFLCVVTEDDPWCWVLRPRGSAYAPFEDACRKAAGMIRAWESKREPGAWRRLLERSREVRRPVYFEPAPHPATGCPAYRGVIRGYPRCAANDVAPWERFEDHPGEPGVATCGQCNWPAENSGTGQSPT